jgi:hypothetical protein
MLGMRKKKRFGSRSFPSVTLRSGRSSIFNTDLAISFESLNRRNWNQCAPTYFDDG